jgi:acyl carrier protein
MSSTVTTAEVEEVVVGALRELVPEAAEISRDSDFETLDVDSLDLAELAQIIEDRFGIQLKGSDVAEVSTVGEAIDLVLKTL